MTARDDDGYTIIHRDRAGVLGDGFNLVGLPTARPLSSAVAPPLRTLPRRTLPSAWFSEPDRNFLCVNTHLFVAPGRRVS